jgi:hypothetical protein
MIFHHGSISYAHEVKSSLKTSITDGGYQEAGVSVVRPGKPMVRMGKEISKLPKGEDISSIN